MPHEQWTREQLIDLCEQAMVPYEHWHDRDSQSAQVNIGQAWALLRAGCPFVFSADPATDEDTIWIRVKSPGFFAFESGFVDDWGGDSHWEDDLFYIPTPERLDRRPGKDWY